MIYTLMNWRIKEKAIIFNKVLKLKQPERSFYMNKNVLVTGGTRGIGEAIVREFAKKGYDIIINYVKSNKKAEKLKSITYSSRFI